MASKHQFDIIAYEESPSFGELAVAAINPDEHRDGDGNILPPTQLHLKCRLHGQKQSVPLYFYLRVLTHKRYNARAFQLTGRISARPWKIGGPNSEQSFECIYDTETLTGCLTMWDDAE